MKTLLKSALVCVIVFATMTATAQPPQEQRQQRTPEEMAKTRTEQLKKDLGLNDAQEKQVYDMQLKMSREMQALRGEGRQPDREKMRAEMEKRQETMKAGMKKILTEEQFAKWEKQQAEMPRGRRGQGQGGQRPDRQ